jgi:hypothetical protein
MEEVHQEAPRIEKMLLTIGRIKENNQQPNLPNGTLRPEGYTWKGKKII